MVASGRKLNVSTHIYQHEFVRSAADKIIAAAIPIATRDKDAQDAYQQNTGKYKNIIAIANPVAMCTTGAIQQSPTSAQSSEIEENKKGQNTLRKRKSRARSWQLNLPLNQP